MSNIIELSSDEDDRKSPAVEFIDSGISYVPARKLRKLSSSKPDIIVLDEDDSGMEEPSKNESENDINAGNVQEPVAILDKSIEIMEEVLSQSQYDNVDSPDSPVIKDADQDSPDIKDAPTVNRTKPVDGDDSEASKASADESKEPLLPNTALSEALEGFVRLCETSISVEQIRVKFREKIPILKKVYQRSSEYAASKGFERKVGKLTKEILENPKLAVLHFQTVFRDLQENCNQTTTSHRVSKYERLLEKLKAKIIKLENEEVDFDEEENSSYLKMQRYRERATAVFKKINKLQKEDPNRGRPYYSRLDFAHSAYPEINRALNKKYQNRDKNPFPTLHEVDSCIRKCVEENNFDISEGRLKMEIKGCFEQLGNLIQKKRKVELANVHLEYIGNIQEDPAKHDAELNRKLLENQNVFKTDMKKVLDKFERMQEQGVSVELSEDSDDSHGVDSENEDGNNEA